MFKFYDLNLNQAHIVLYVLITIDTDEEDTLILMSLNDFLQNICNREYMNIGSILKKNVRITQFYFCDKVNKHDTISVELFTKRKYKTEKKQHGHV